MFGRLGQRLTKFDQLWPMFAKFRRCFQYSANADHMLVDVGQISKKLGASWPDNGSAWREIVGLGRIASIVEQLWRNFGARRNRQGQLREVRWGIFG